MISFSIFLVVTLFQGRIYATTGGDRVEIDGDVHGGVIHEEIIESEVGGGLMNDEIVLFQCSYADCGFFLENVTEVLTEVVSDSPLLRSGQISGVDSSAGPSPVTRYQMEYDTAYMLDEEDEYEEGDDQGEEERDEQVQFVDEHGNALVLYHPGEEQPHVSVSKAIAFAGCR